MTVYLRPEMSREELDAIVALRGFVVGDIVRIRGDLSKDRWRIVNDRNDVYASNSRMYKLRLLPRGYARPKPRTKRTQGFFLELLVPSSELTRDEQKTFEALGGR